MQVIPRLVLTGILFAGVVGSFSRAEVAVGEPNSPETVSYGETLRPQFHFTYKVGWLSDINGPFYYKGTYHLFTQHVPGGPGLDYAKIHWGHAVSEDLLHWRELPPVLAPDEHGPIFSGGGSVIDRRNTSGLKTGEEDVIVAFYTIATYMGTDKPGTQGIAYSNDGGYTWTKYDGNPVVGPITRLNRDPKVFRHEPSRRWIMVMTLNCEAWDVDNRFITLWSKDLKEWHELQRFDMPTACDCPDMFELPVDGDMNDKRWVIWGGDCTYMIGTFDGTTFTRQGEIHQPPVAWMNQGSGGYASQTFSNTPECDKRRIQMSWLYQRAEYPGMPFNQQASFPLELTLKTFEDGIRLCRYPYRGISELHEKAFVRDGVVVKPGESLSPEFESDTFDIDLRFTPGDAKRVCLRVRGIDIIYDPATKTVSCYGSSAKLAPIDGRLELRVLVDRCSIELFGNGGRLVMFYGFPLEAAERSVHLTCEGGPVEVARLAVHSVKSIWKK